MKITIELNTLEELEQWFKNEPETKENIQELEKNIQEDEKIKENVNFWNKLKGEKDEEGKG